MKRSGKRRRWCRRRRILIWNCLFVLGVRLCLNGKPMFQKRILLLEHFGLSLTLSLWLCYLLSLLDLKLHLRGGICEAENMKKPMP